MSSIILSLILISIIFATLGVIALWKKYIYFGDGLAHSSFLAVNISIIAYLPLVYSGAFIAIIFAILVYILKEHSGKSAAISLTSSSMLATSLIISHLHLTNNNITNLLFGDILSVSYTDLILLGGIAIFIVTFVALFSNQIILTVINRDIAIIKGIKVKEIELTFLLILSLSIFATTKIVGALMITAILLVPAMSARLVSRNPVQMILASVTISLFTNFCAAGLSFYLDLPLTPLIIVTGGVIYTILLTINWIRSLKTTN